MDISQLLAFSVKQNASDLHLSGGLPPMIRVDGDMRRINLPPLEHKEVFDLIYDIMNDRQRKAYDEHLETDFSFEIPNLARFRVNAFRQRAHLRQVAAKRARHPPFDCGQRARSRLVWDRRRGLGGEPWRGRCCRRNGDGRNRRWQQKGGLDSRRGCLQPWRDDAVADGDANDQAENDPDHHIAHDSALPNFNTTTGGSASVSPFSLGSGLVSVKKLVCRNHGCLTPSQCV